MSEEKFVFSKNTPIVIYGCSKSGIEIYHKLVDAGYHVSCFIDCRAQEYHHVCYIGGRNVPVYQLEEYGLETMEPIFFIAIRNSIEQTNVAKNLWQRRFRKVIFFPMIKSNRRNHKYIECLKDFYTNFVEGKIEDNSSLPTLALLWEEDIFWDHALIWKNETNVLAWMPIALIHYYSEEQGGVFSRMLTPEEKEDISWDKNVFQLKWLSQLIQFFVKGEGDLEYYSFQEGKCDAANILKEKSAKVNQLWFADRQKCIELLMLGLNVEKEFWIQSAIPVQWNHNGYFNICDGSHRLVFFSNMEMQMVPVKLSLKDYKNWVNDRALEQVLSFIKENEITSFETPIPHPWFYECEAKEEKFGRTILKCMFEQIDMLNLKKNFSVLDTNPADGYYLQYFARMNEAGKIVGLVRDKIKLGLIARLNRLFYLDERIQLIEDDVEIDDDSKYDVVLMFKTLCSLEAGDRVRYLKWIESKASNLIVWESGVDYEEEKSFIMQHSAFQKYIFLKRTLSDNIIREVGIFSREIFSSK